MSVITLEEARNILHHSNNKNARILLGYTSTCMNVMELSRLHMNILDAYKSHKITDQEHEALERICNYVMVSEFSKTVISEVTLTDIFKKRLEESEDIETAVQFRNCVTDMYMLGMITLEEYVELNNSIDYTVQSAITEAK